MYVNKIGSANPDIYLPVEDAEYNKVEEVEVAYASPAQINFMKTLLRQNNIEEKEVLEDYGIENFDKLTKYDASVIIGMYTGK